MIAAWLSVVTLAATATPDVLVFELRSERAGPEALRLIERDVVEEVVAQGRTAAGMSDLRALMDVEAARQAADCDDSASCLAEIAGGLGAAEVITGEVVRLGGSWTLSLSRLETKSSSVLGRASAEARSLEELKRLTRATARRLFVVEDASPPWLTITGATAAGVGLLAGVIGALPLADALGRAGDADRAAEAFADDGDSADLRALSGAHREYESARGAYHTWGLPLLITGGALVVVGAGLVVGDALVE